MHSTQISEMIKNDVVTLRNQYQETETFFLEPKLASFKDNNDEITELWIIFKKDEYMITFDEKRQTYGLAFTNIFKDFVSLAEYNSISDAYKDLINREE